MLSGNVTITRGISSWSPHSHQLLIMRKCLLLAPIVADKVIISRHLSYIISALLAECVELKPRENRNVFLLDWPAHKQVCKWYLFYLLLGLLVGQVNEPINWACLSSQRDITDIPGPRGWAECCVCSMLGERELFVKLDVCKIGGPLLENLTFDPELNILNKTSVATLRVVTFH